MRASYSSRRSTLACLCSAATAHTMAAAPPQSLRGKIVAYLNQAKERSDAGEALIAYYCKVHALSEAMAVRSQIPKADMGYVIGLMDQVEAEKKRVGNLDDAQMLIEMKASELFDRADTADRATPTVPRLQTAKDFYAAATLFEVCKEFGELPDDLSEKVKYGKWRYIEICKAAKEKRAPEPPRGLDLGEDGADGGAPEGDPPPAATSSSAQYDAPGHSAGAAYYDGGASYLDLPSAAPAHAQPSTAAGFSSSSFQAPAPPSHAPPVRGPSFTPPSHPGFKPDRNAIVEAAGLAKSAVSSLQFQNIDTAVANLQKAITLLTMPQAPTDDDATP